VGQCAVEKERILLTDVPDDYIRINSGLGESKPLNIVVLPVIFEGHVKAVIELASFYRFSETHLSFLDQLTESIGIVLNTIAAGMRTEELLKQSQSLADELRSGQQELTETNRRLEQQAKSLQASEERLKQQQEELQQTNEELEEKAELLAKQNREVENKNEQIEMARTSLEEKAEQLALTSRYKSEFVANMSHELRTPLNSLLILSRMLVDNAEGNLTDKQVSFAHTIHASGNDLLSLINDILDLSKIESGTLAVEPSEVMLDDLRAYVEQGFRHVAHEKGLEFNVELTGRPPASIHTDPKRLQQVLKNLLSNAFKFTERGSVTMTISTASYGWNREHSILNRAECVVAFSVSDTGMGIAEDKQRIIFEAFQQADGTTSRRFGGTGLGLSISREIANLLGGEIRVVSMLGSGSTFTFYLPSQYVAPSSERGRRSEPRPPVPVLGIAEDRTQESATERAPGGGCLLLLGNADAELREALHGPLERMGLAPLVSEDPRVDPAQIAKLHANGIIVDLRSGNLDGWIALDRLKHTLATAHLPVVALSTQTDRPKALHMGAVEVIQRLVPGEVERALRRVNALHPEQSRRLLLISEDSRISASLVPLLGGEGVDVRSVTTGTDAQLALSREDFQCVVLGLGEGPALLEPLLRQAASVPLLVHALRPLSEAESAQISAARLRQPIEVTHSAEQLIRHSCLALHRPEETLPSGQRRLLLEATQRRAALAGMRVLIIDDDVRNIFAMTSALERHGALVNYADNGQQGLELLNSGPPPQAVLVDIMMPELDGYEIMRRIREQPRHAQLPLIAVTAKAMPADREKCIRAGATHYLAKPVDAGQLVSALRVATTE